MSAQTTDCLAGLVESGFRAGAIYADPPWTFKVYSGKGKSRSAENHYNTMEQQSIKELGYQVKELSAENCALFMWCVMPQIPEALELIKAWGFEYKTVAFTWVKLNKSCKGYFMGMGYWTRANPEICLLATKGSPKRTGKGVEQLIVEPRGAHSSKPVTVQERIEKLVAGPYLELFGRRPRDGWTTFGDQIENNLFHRVAS